MLGFEPQHSGSKTLELTTHTALACYIDGPGSVLTLPAVGLPGLRLILEFLVCLLLQAQASRSIAWRPGTLASSPAPMLAVHRVLGHTH